MRRTQIWAGSILLVSTAVMTGFYFGRSGGAMSRASSVVQAGGSHEPVAPPDTGTSSLRTARRSLEALVLAAGGNDWEEAQLNFASFQESTRILPAPELIHPDVSMVLLDFFALYQVQLGRAIERRESERVLFASNQLEGIVDDLIARVNPGLPSELARLRFLSRDIHYWANTGDEQMLQVRAAGLGRVWSDLRPLVLDRDGRRAAENFDIVLSQLESAGAPEAIQTLTPRLQDAVIQIEAVLAKK